MYKDFYQMKMEAFGNLPLLKIFFNSPTHNNAWHYLLYGINSHEPFMIITGDYGMGKTTLCLGLIRMLKKKREIPFAYISTPNYDYTKILSEIAARLKLEPAARDESGLQAEICHYFKENPELRSFYIIIDDAHDLSVSTLEKLRSLANFNYNGVFPFRFIFFAHTSFLEKLKSATLIPIYQRIKRRAQLVHLTYAEVKEYIFSRLLKAGAPGIPTFTEEALQKIFSYSQGIPRLINNICDATLLIGASRELTRIDGTVVNQALNYLSAPPAPRPAEPVRPDRAPAATPVPAPEPSEEQKPAYQAASPMLKLELSAPGPEAPKGAPKSKRLAKRLAWITAIFFLLVIIVWAIGIIFNLIRPIGKLFQRETEPAYQTETVPEPSRSPQKAAIEDEMVRKPEPEHPYDPSGHLHEMASGILSLPKEGLNRAVAAMQPQAPEAERSSYPYSLHLGSYRELDKALESEPFYMDTGLTPYLVRVHLGTKGTWWRVYAGHFSTEAEARRIKDWYHLSDAAIIKTDYADFIGVFASQSQMSPVSKKIEDSGYFPYVIKGEHGTLNLYVGAFESREDAEQQRAQMAADGIQSRVVLR